MVFKDANGNYHYINIDAVIAINHSFVKDKGIMYVHFGEDDYFMYDMSEANFISFIQSI